MPNRLADAVSPYLRSHAENPVDWFEWGAEAFSEAKRRDVPVLVSIGYSTCHWCHVMARESFSDPGIAALLNDGFVAVKVDREEHPDVDATYLAAAQAFTPHLGWPLNVFVTPTGRAFFAGTYFPPAPVGDHPAFRTVLDAVTDAWRDRRTEVESNAAVVTQAITTAADPAGGGLPTSAQWGSIVRQLEGYEDRQYGGFGGAPKFPVAPVLLMLQQADAATSAPGRGGDAVVPAQRRGDDDTVSAQKRSDDDTASAPGRGDAPSAALAARTLAAMAASDLRDPVEGGFFRYATRRDWTEPHYERMLYDNAQLLDAYSRTPGDVVIAEGIVAFLRDVLRLPGGAFASAQDSESTVDGERVEGGYYALGADARARQHPPALDEKVLTGWTGLAIEALANAGARRARPEWIDLAKSAADRLLRTHVRPDGTLVRASIADRMSDAAATLEDYGMFAAGLIAVALATGESSYAVAARSLVDATLRRDGSAASGSTAAGFAAPGGGDPVLSAQGLILPGDPSEGAYPSGVTAIAGAAHSLYLLTADRRYLDAALTALSRVAALAVERPISFGAALAVMLRLGSPVIQLVVVGDDPAMGDAARSWSPPGSVAVVVSERQAASFADAGFELFEGRTIRDGATAAYLCRDFVCRLPIIDPVELATALDA